MRKSAQVSANALPAGAKNLGIDQALAGRGILPEFRWETDINSITQARVAKLWNGSGGGLVRIPWQVVDSAGAGSGWQTHSMADEWKVDITATTINTSTLIGGLIDGGAKANGDDLLVWAFFDPGDQVSKFKGIGCTIRPYAAYTGITGTGAKASSTTFNMAGSGNNRGTRFAVGARVIVRTNATPGGTNYNQGSITSRTNTTVVVTLDNKAYGGTVSGAGTIIQTAGHQPRLVGATDTLYPGAGVEYAYSYLGSISLDTTIILAYARQRGDWWWSPATDAVYSVALAATTNATVYLAQHVPQDAVDINLFMNIVRSVGAGIGGRIYAGSSATRLTPFFQTSDTIGAETQRASGTIQALQSAGAIYVGTTVPAATTMTVLVLVNGYRELNW